MEGENKNIIDYNRKNKILKIIRDIIFVVASIFGIIAFVRTCVHDNEFKDLNYKLTSLEHQPILKLADTPRISDISIDSLSVKFREHPNKHSGDQKDPHIVGVRVSLTIKSEIKITNVSENSIGKIKVLMTTDNVSNVKDFIMGKYTPENLKTNFHKWPELANSHVLPGDTIELAATTKIRFIDDRKYVMHFIIIYLNDLGNLYHTHAKVPFEFKPLFIQTKKEMKVKELERELYKTAEKLIKNNTLMRPLNPVSSYVTYDRKEGELAKKNLKKLMQELSID